VETLIGVVPDNWRDMVLSDVCDILAGPSGARFPATAQANSG